MSTSLPTETIRDVIIVGSGPAGYTAGIYTGRANLKPLIVAGMMEPGGELMKTTEVENYPGFPEGIDGPDLMANMESQAERFGAEILFEEASELELEGPVKKVTTTDGEVHYARTVILSTGSAHRKLGLPNEDALSGHGVSYCATCDGSFFKDLEVAVVGGGDSAAEEALFLTKFAKAVHLIVRGDQLRASKIMADRVLANPKISVEFETEVVGILGQDKLIGLILRSKDREYDYTVPADGLFVAIGNDPRTALVASQLDLTAQGTVAVDGRTSKTNLPGVFAAGDVIDPTYRQAITAAASGCVAAQDVEHFLANSVPALLEAATA
ncbi:thioredoxin reductase (plasmid) [Pseudarthrobacter chlorophenolicus A6]|uniref:Thioredoxin reductase n=1 Tax=Pseudarthrobacter chlorophenolicus (strain ATCC 700700 / DSM 12829 / CIP 107037 / JCM 12360 / KCTC 9906 / NCIMB 13794 / A6) TaxID=452863 RepID=B8HHP2_PSECP|nr:thioredoxin-disulfide reductase [Pseudarthrobacter chlorophenolicus]ACL41939.1 thioredoxin reductase [Pseudarthrobacter chlorophenolicus A6]